ncbi:hypothetical protein DRJ04_00210 [Candidatus Aerophobetes bacterium]|mgnify:CR=1 FL=1|uniref:Lipid A biosynthesis acyltransferase n=1 Tax=Aerophobetes bacterium TaxID=2030807 RepID=A0A662DNP7_UNCAE|nr:MAG: hypothetical protein DRJ04_00210 [Candidatus Aerophobetes bacterium]
MWVFILYKAGQILSCYLPSSLAYWIARRIADLLFAFPFGKCKLYKEAVLHNLDLITNCNNKTKMTREVFRNFASYVREFLWLARMDKSRFFRKVMPVGIENLDAALKRGKGVLLLSAHFGNWEWGGISLALCGYNVYFLVRPHINPHTNRLFCSLREKGNIKIIPVTHLRKAVKLLRGNAVVATLVDEADEGVKVNLFGKKVAVASGPFKIAYRAGAAICPAFMVKDKKTGKQKGVVEPPIKLSSNTQTEKSIQMAAQRFIQIMEDYLRFYPHQWFLFKEKRVYSTTSCEGK